MKKKRIVENDKSKILATIEDLDQKKNQAINIAWQKVFEPKILSFILCEAKVEDDVMLIALYSLINLKQQLCLIKNLVDFLKHFVILDFTTDLQRFICHSIMVSSSACLFLKLY